MPMTPSAVDAADALSNLSKKKHIGKGTRRYPCDNCGGRISVKVSPAMKKILEDEKEPNICSACYNMGQLKEARRKVLNRMRPQQASVPTPIRKLASAAISSLDPRRTQKKTTEGPVVATTRAPDVDTATLAVRDTVPDSSTDLAGSGGAMNVSAAIDNKIAVSAPTGLERLTGAQYPSVDSPYQRWTINHSPTHIVKNGRISADTSGRESLKKKAAAGAASANQAKIRLLDIERKIAEIKASKQLHTLDIERKKAEIQLQEQDVRDAEEQLSTLEEIMQGARKELGDFMAAAKIAKDAQMVAEEREAAEKRETAEERENEGFEIQYREKK